MGEVAADFAEDAAFLHLKELDPAGVVGFDDEDAVADVARAGVGGDVDAGELAPTGEEGVVLVGAVDLRVVEVGFEDFADAFGAFAGAAAEFGPVGDGVGGVMLVVLVLIARAILVLGLCVRVVRTVVRTWVVRGVLIVLFYVGILVFVVQFLLLVGSMLLFVVRPLLLVVSIF